MAKSKITLPNGTIITVDGTPEEIQKIMATFSSASPSHSAPTKTLKKKENKGGDISGEQDVIVNIANAIKESEDAENIEKNILERSSQVNRILLPLYINSKKFGNKLSLTTGDISQVLTELGTPINVANVSHALAGIASKYVMGDKTRKKGQSTKYKISLRGTNYLKSVIDSGK